MRIANIGGRVAVMVSDEKASDLGELSQGEFGPEPEKVYENWDRFTDWIARVDYAASARSVSEGEFATVVPAPRQVFGVAMNYRDHAEEIGIELPESPSVFTKFPSSLTGPFDRVELPEVGNCDYEVEIVAVIGRQARHVAVDDAWSYILGLTVGQDISERIAQNAGQLPQFSVAKSMPGFGPIGPWVVTTDEFDSPDDLELVCTLNGGEVQRARSSNLIFSIPELVSRLSRSVTLLPGDLIFTGTPSGVGAGRRPQRFLKPGDELGSWVEGIGSMRNEMVAQ